MITFKCHACGQAMKAAPEYAGKKTRCPGCQQIVPIPAGASQPPTVPEAPVRASVPPRRSPAAPPRPAAAPLMEVESADPEPVEPRRRRPRDDDEDDRPRRRRRARSGGEWAECPKCGCPGDATRISWTWWGGLIGPAIINVVRCNDCGTQYNGKSGQYNTGAITIYFVVTLAIAFAILIAAAVAEGL